MQLSHRLPRRYSSHSSLTGLLRLELPLYSELTHTTKPAPALLLVPQHLNPTRSSSWLPQHSVVAQSSFTLCSEPTHSSIRADHSLLTAYSQLTHSLLHLLPAYSSRSASLTADLQLTHGQSPLTVYSSAHSSLPPALLRGYSLLTHSLLTASPGYAALHYCRLSQSSASSWGTEGLEWGWGWVGSSSGDT